MFWGKTRCQDMMMRAMGWERAWRVYVWLRTVGCSPSMLPNRTWVKTCVIVETARYRCSKSVRVSVQAPGSGSHNQRRRCSWCCRGPRGCGACRRFRLPTDSVRAAKYPHGPFHPPSALAVAELLVTVLRLETCGDQTLSYVYVHSMSNTG
jgi:hypothetical protein